MHRDSAPCLIPAPVNQVGEGTTVLYVYPTGSVSMAPVTSPGNATVKLDILEMSAMKLNQKVSLKFSNKILINFFVKDV